MNTIQQQVNQIKEQKPIMLREGVRPVQDDAHNICWKGNAYKAWLE